MHAKIAAENLSENWLDAQQVRANSVSSYEISAIAGLDKYNSALNLWALKTGKKKADRQSDQMWLASKMQPVIVTLMARNTGIRVVDPNALFVHPTEEIAACRPAGLICNEDDYSSATGIVKVAKVHERNMKEWGDDETEIPEKHLIRAQWELGIMGYETCQFGVLSSADVLTVRTVEYDEEIFNRALELAHRFLKCVREDVPPNPGAGDRKLIQEIVGQRGPATIDLTQDEELPQILDDLSRFGDQRRRLNREAKELEIAEKALKNRILLKAGKHGVVAARKLSGDSVRITLKEEIVEARMQSGYDWTRFTIK